MGVVALFFFFFFSVLLACWGVGVLSLTEFSLDPQSVDTSFARQSLLPDSKFPYVARDGAIFLTQDPTDGTRASTLYNVGRLLFRKSVLPFKDDQHQIFSFTSWWRFNITTATRYNESGDGIAFVMTSDREIPRNSTGRLLGLMPEFPKDRNQSFFAVEFDTFQNLQPEIADPSASHIGININNLSSIAYLDSSDESHPLYLYKNATLMAWVAYNASTHLIQVWATNSSDYRRPQEPILSIQCNLSQVFENYTEIYVGIIAASGNNSQATILYNWNFTLVDDKQVSGDKNHRSRTSPLWYILAPAVLVAVCIFAAVICLALCSKKRRQRNDVWESVYRFKLKDLKQATQRFNEAQKIGEGGSSEVYKGVLDDRREVAVKRMRHGSSMKAEKLMVDEMRIISRLQHPHLLLLQGWCYEKGEALLVYEYLPQGGLDSYLYGDKRRSGQVLDTDTRFKILVNVASALEYLHEHISESERVLHLDVKAANVLLKDSTDPPANMEARLADFGLSRLMASDKLQVTLTLMAGTPGYMAPEISAIGRVDEKVDVYSFGVLLLEVACGRKPSNSQGKHLVDLVWQYHQTTCILDALDPHLILLQLQAPEKWRCVLHLGLLCCQTSPEARPCMSRVRQALEDCEVLPLPEAWNRDMIREL